MTDQYMLMIGGLVLLLIVCFGAFIYNFTREVRLGSMATSHSQTDLTNMMILFQTMRDLLSQQKDLAREFNISIDKKVNEVRELIQSTGDVRGELERAKREIAALATRTRKEMAALERKLGEVDESAPNSQYEEEPPDDRPFPNEAVAGASGVSAAEPEGPEDEWPTPLEIVPEPREPEPDFIDRWSGVDLGDAGSGASGEVNEFEFESSEYGEDDGADVYTEADAREAEETREAFRDLLNLQPAANDRPQGPTSADVLDAGRETNGGQYLTPIQKRVYEYSDAGMRVPEIARELGVGKGEVRLILSLRQDREH